MQKYGGPENFIQGSFFISLKGVYLLGIL